MRLVFFVLGILAGNCHVVQTETLIEACLMETFHASCKQDEVIQMTSAEFGRMEAGRCITVTDFLGCTNNVLPLLNRWCSGQQKCDFPVVDLDQENTECSAALRMYLKVTHSCLKVENSCQSSRQSSILSNTQGYLSNQVQCSPASGPLVIQAQLGQTINMSIIDFAANDQTENYVSCKYVYGYILERALGINHTICGGRQREQPLYTSKTNKVEIYFASGRQEQSFLVHYQVVGCPDMKRPPHTSYKRQGNQAVIGCEITGQEWTLTCTGNTWQGDIGNCTKIVADPVVTQEQTDSVEVNTVVVMTAVAGGAVVLVVVVIVIGVVYLNKYRMKQETKHMKKTYATIDRNILTQYRQTTGDTFMNSPPLLPGTNTINKAQDNSWLVPASDPSDLPLPPYPGQCECGTLPVTGTGNNTLGTTSSGRHSLYNSIT